MWLGPQGQTLLRPAARTLRASARARSRRAARAPGRTDLARLSDHDLDDLWDELLDLPATDLSLLVELPKLITPDLERLRECVAADDPDRGADALAAVAAQIDTPRQRARLADALIRLRDERRIDDRPAAAAILDLDSRSTYFIAASLLEAVAVSAGAATTPGGLHIAA